MGARPRKSKEQKQAEKDSIEATQPAIDAGESRHNFLHGEKKSLNLNQVKYQEAQGVWAICFHAQ
jgi:hypothetical protein